MKKRTIDDNITFIPHDETTTVAEPRKGSFNLPAAFISTQFSAVFVLLFLVVLPVRADQLNAALGQSFPQRVAIIASVSDDPFGLLFGPSAPCSGHGNVFQRGFNERDFAGARRVQVEPQRNSLAVDHHHPLRAFAAFSFSDTESPFLAEAKLPSTNASLQSNCSCLSSSDSNDRHAVNQTSCSSHSRKRRQHVDALGYSFGISDHGAPVRNIQSMPSKTFRLFALGRPPFLPALGSGNKGASFAQRSSVNFQRVLAMKNSPFSWPFSHNNIRHNMSNSTIFRF